MGGPERAPHAPRFRGYLNSIKAWSIATTLKLIPRSSRSPDARSVEIID